MEDENLIIEDDDDDDSVQIISVSEDAIFSRLAAQIEEKHRTEEEKRQQFKTKRETERAHGRYLTQNASSAAEVAEAQVAAREYSNRNRVKVLDKIQPGPSSSSASPTDLPVKLKINFHCPILNCGVGFTTVKRYNEHMQINKHSPCQPCMHLPDCIVVCDQVAFLCPVCGQLYSTASECLQHMNSNDHNVFMMPQRVGGYLCPQCLQVFPSREICRQHMVAYSHWDCSYPFIDDVGVAVPQRVPIEFIEMFRQACTLIPWSMQCITCDTAVYSRDVKSHIQKDHIVCSMTDKTAEDVFTQFLKGYTCIQCFRMFDHPHHHKGGIHNCGPNTNGFIIENDCKTFEEFVRRLSLPLNENDKVEDLTREEDDMDLIVVCDSDNEPGSSKRKNNAHVQEPAKKRAKESPSTELSRKTSSLSLTDTQPASTNPSIVINTDYVKSINQSKKPRKSRWSAIENLPGIRPCIMNTNDSTDNQRSADIPSFPSTSQTTSSQGISSTDSSSCRQTTTLPAPSSTSSSSIQPLLAVQPTPGTSCLPDPGPSTSSNFNRGLDTRFIRNPNFPVYTQNNPAGHFERPVIRFSRMPSCIPYRFTATTGPNSSYLAPSSTYSNRNRLYPDKWTDSQSGRSRSPNHQPFRPNYQHRRRSPSPNFLNRRPSPNRRFNYNGGAEVSAELHHRENEPKNLDSMKQIIFLDLDNWPAFFKRLTEPLPKDTFVWGFFGGAMSWKEPLWDRNFYTLKRAGCFFLHPKCGRSKDAADFALVMTVGRLDERLPKTIAFTILSGDRGFVEVERQMSTTTRRTVVINPHKQEALLVYALIKSVGEA